MVFHVTKRLLLCFFSACLWSSSLAQVHRCGYTTLTWYSKATMCDGAAGTVLSGDFNGDHHDDIVCMLGATVEFYLAKETGSYDTASFKTLSNTGTDFCGATLTNVQVGDFNGDGRADLLCVAANGELTVIYALRQNKFTDPEPIPYQPLCSDTIKVGDFDGNAVTDFLCWDSTSGDVTIHYRFGFHRRVRRHYGTYHLPKKVLDGDFCPAEDMHIGDFNGDARSDILCRVDASDASGSATSEWTMHLADPLGDFDSSSSSTETNSFCSTQTLIFGDVNADHRTDLVCDTSGVITMSYAGENGLPLVTIPNTSVYTSFDASTDCSGGVFATTMPDADGDGKADLFCKSVTVGKLSLLHYAVCSVS